MQKVRPGRHDLWFENAVVYCLDVETFADADGDGVGDFLGLTRRLDYLSGLGVTCLWLMPFFPTPNRDDGYDISDYCAVDPRYGTLADFTEFLVEAQDRGMRTIIDLVPNHTSNEHPWFQQGRCDPQSPYRDYYVWRTDAPGDTSDQAVFPGYQEGIWTYDECAEAYYLHHFYDFQPDLNYTNPAVREEFRKIVGFWLQLGVSGFRVDAAPFLINQPGIHENDNGLETAHELLRELHEFATVRRGDAILLGEVDESLSVIGNYFGGGNELQALFNFPLNRYLFLGLAQETADPVKFGLQQLPKIPARGQWLNFLRHHDELNLSRLTMAQREAVYAAYAPEPEMRIYDRGIRRRLASMLGGDQDRVRLAYSALFSLPGAPMVFYGEEIGMAECLELPERLSVRTPMQWTPYDNGGFSTTDPEDFVRPMVADGSFGFENVNVATQRADPDSLLNWMSTLMRTRRECDVIGSGSWRIIDTGTDTVLGVRFEDEQCAMIVLNNFSRQRQHVTLELSDRELATATELLADRRYSPINAETGRLRLEPNGYRWLRFGGIY